MRNPKIKICKECGKEFPTIWNNVFCGHSCSSIFAGRHRGPTSDQTKQKQKDGLIAYWAAHPEKRKKGKEMSEFVGGFTKGKYKGNIQSILQVSKRTASKILKRLGLGCSVCGWKDGACDIHHIHGRKIENPHRHSNLTLVCPNHHRLLHEKKVLIDNIVTLDKFFPENWRDLYYG